MTDVGTCPICNLEDESLFHRFRNCSRSRNIWWNLGVRNQDQFFRNHNWKNWMEINLKKNINDDVISNWNLLFGVVLDSLWRSRNEWIFKQKQSSVLGDVILIQSQVKCIVEVLQRSVSLRPGRSTGVTIDVQRWIPPPSGVMKLNCDGSVKNHGRDAGCGGVLRDNYGCLIFAFAHKLEAYSVLEAKLWSIYHELSLACGKGFTNLIVESDSTMALRMIEEGGSSDAAVHLLISEILEIVKKSIDVVGWSKIDRDMNSVADMLASYSYKIRDMNVIFDVIPDFLVHVISQDSIGLASPSMN